MNLIERLQWIADLEDVDHEICEIAQDAIEEILFLRMVQSRMIMESEE